MNYLYLTNDNDAVYNIARDYADEHFLELFVLDFTDKTCIDSIKSVLRDSQEVCFLLYNIKKSSRADSLLKLLESNVTFFATTNDSISDALKSRFVVSYIEDAIYNSEILSFLVGKSIEKTTYSDAAFYKALARYCASHYNDSTYGNLLLIADILNNFQLSTTNLNYSYEYKRLCEGFKR